MTVHRLLNTRLPGKHTQLLLEEGVWRFMLLERVGAPFSEEEFTAEGGNGGMIYAAVYFKEKKYLTEYRRINF